MSTPLAFISYDFKLAESERARFIQESAACPQPFTVDDWSVARRSPKEDWDKLIHSKIGRCDFMIVLVAEAMESGPVEEEILEAKRCNVPFFGVYVGGAESSSKLPAGLPANRMLPWDWARIGAAVRQVTGEGKHHVFR